VPRKKGETGENRHKITAKVRTKIQGKVQEINDELPLTGANQKNVNQQRDPAHSLNENRSEPTSGHGGKNSELEKDLRERKRRGLAPPQTVNSLSGGVLTGSGTTPVHNQKKKKPFIGVALKRVQNKKGSA